MKIMLANDSGNSALNSPDYFKLFDEGSSSGSSSSGGSGDGGDGGGGVSINGDNSGSNSDVNSGNSDGISSNLVNLNLTKEDSYYQQLSNSDVNKSGDNNIRAYESGSNFMLLLEDFGEYFYNFNGTGTTNVNNTTEEYFHTNCSIGNSTCSDINEGEFARDGVSLLYTNLVLFYFYFIFKSQSLKM